MWSVCDEVCGVSMRVTVGCVRIRGYKDEELVYEMCGMWDVWGVRLCGM